MLRIVVGTRYDQLRFQRYTLLGRSLGRLLIRMDVSVSVSDSNSRGLPEIFNEAVKSCENSDIVVFTHDDVWIDDYFLPERLQDALTRFAVVGVAGNRRRIPGQPTWAFIDTKQTWDDPQYLSGTVIHLNGPKETPSRYGDTPSPVKLLDGIFLATKVGTLRDKGISFDTRFGFHFYDLDFCRSCEAAGLAMGTWPIALTHASRGNFMTAEWAKAYEIYLDKWKS
jgi:hypothetical protein